jgi:mitofilin
MKYYILLLVLSLSLSTYAQKVEKDGKTYEVKKEKIFLDGEEVTDSLNLEEKTAILKQASIISEKIELQEKAEKEAGKLQKEMKKAEKKQKRHKKRLKKL